MAKDRTRSQIISGRGANTVKTRICERRVRKGLGHYGVASE